MAVTINHAACEQNATSEKQGWHFLINSAHMDIEEDAFTAFFATADCGLQIALTSGRFCGAKRSDCGQGGRRIYAGFGKEFLHRGVCVGQSVR